MGDAKAHESAGALNLVRGPSKHYDRMLQIVRIAKGVVGTSYEHRQVNTSEISIRIASSDEDKKKILQLRNEVYVREQGRLENASDLADNVFGRFERFSTYFVAYADATPVGTIRVISDSGAGLPCEKNCDLASFRLHSRMVEFGHFICVPEYRARGIGFLLLKEVFGFSVVCLNATHVLADIFTDDTSSLGAKFFLTRGFTQIGETYFDARFAGNPQSMVVMLNVQHGLKFRERARAVQEFLCPSIPYQVE